MPKPRETWDLIFYLKDNLQNPGCKELYDLLLKKTPEDTWHGAWQNAFYEEDSGGKMYVKDLTGFNSNNEPVFSQRREITDYIKNDCYADITNRVNITDEGLVRVVSSNQKNYQQGEDIMSWKPRDKAVAWFGADSDGAGFDWDGDPACCDASLGVVLAAKKF